MARELVRVEELRKYFPVRGGVFHRVVGYVKAVDGVSFRIEEGTTFGLVGESGCGKTTLVRTILRLIEPTAGRVIFDGVDITALRAGELRRMRRHMQIVFQDPYTSLHPRMQVSEIVAEPLRIHFGVGGEEARGEVLRVLREVGLGEEHLDRYPHELSGGQRQRVAIARALILRPKFLVLDEPTSALDVSVQAKILRLLKELQSRYGLTYLFVSHNILVIEYMSDYVGVMYLGKLVEVAPKDELFKNPLHPYTMALLSAVPIPDPRARSRKRIILKGEVPSPLNPPSGCRFHPRCPWASEECRSYEPELVEVGGEHYVACHRWEEIPRVNTYMARR
ncbi:MAG: peptide ABC transporter substrate-binding protein [Thermoprotei archaeon]|nr:MAG: peptide ABC transporter substrate-binding protein [Thermoprotei archaeon]